MKSRKTIFLNFYFINKKTCTVRDKIIIIFTDREKSVSQKKNIFLQVVLFAKIIAEKKIGS